MKSFSYFFYKTKWVKVNAYVPGNKKAPHQERLLFYLMLILFT